MSASRPLRAIPRVKPGCVATVYFGGREYRLTAGELAQYKAAVERGCWVGAEKAACDAENAYRTYCRVTGRVLGMVLHGRRRSWVHVDLGPAGLAIPAPEQHELIDWCVLQGLDYSVEHDIFTLAKVPRARAEGLLATFVNEILKRTVKHEEGRPLLSPIEGVYG